MEEVLYEYSETLEQIALRSGCPITGSVQGWVGQGFEGPDLVKGMAGGLACVVLKGPFHPKPFYEKMKNKILSLFCKN